MKEKINHALHIFFFAAGFVILLLISSAIVIPKNNAKEAGMLEINPNGILAERNHSIDVLVLGDSEAYSSITPMQIWEQEGITSYVCATPRQKLDKSETFMHQAFENQNPKIVILETNLIYREFSTTHTLSQLLDNTFPVLVYHNRWKSLTSSDFGGRIQYTWVNDLKGYIVHKKVKSISPKDYMKTTDEAAKIPLRNKLFIEKMYKYCQDHGSQLVLVSSPSAKNWNYKKHNGIAKLAEEFGLEYLDLNLYEDDIAIDWSKDTRDQGDHINYFGAVKVSEFLGKYLKDNFHLEDHRNDPMYADWFESLERYKEKIASAK